MTKNIKAFIILIFFVVLAGIVIFIFINHNLNFELVDEISVYNLNENNYDTDYFFIKDSDFNGFYDGIGRLKHFVPQFQEQNINTEEFTYIVVINGNLKNISYNFNKCKKRNAIGFPSVYSALIEYEKTDDNVLRIYKIKKINIDYDYHQ